MSISAAAFSGHLTITAPAATHIPGGAFTIGALFKNSASPGTFVWNTYQPNNFSKQSLYFDGDVWYDFDTWDSNFDVSTPKWWYVALTKDSAFEAPRAHVAEYTSSGSMTWSHHDLDTTEPGWSDIDRFSIGDEWANGFGGDLAHITGYDVEYDDAGVAALFGRSSADLLAAGPKFFVHFPQAAGAAGPFVDLAGGGVETIRSGTWSASADPPGFNFSLGRSGKPKTWSGSAWGQHQAKVWTGSAWVNHPMKGYNGSSFVTAK